MDVGIFGAEKAGKTTLFCVLSSLKPERAPMKHEVNRSVVEIRDGRLDRLHELLKTRKKIFATMNLVDIPGFPTACPPKEKNRIMQGLQESDALLAVVRAFRSDIVPWPEDGKNPVSQLENIRAELLFRDLEVAARRIDRIEEHVGKRKLTSEEERELELLKRISRHLDEERFVLDMELDGEETRILSSLSLLTAKPIVVVVNLDEDQYKARNYDTRKQVVRVCEARSLGYAEVAGEFEAELLDLSEEEQTMFMEDTGIAESCFERLHDILYRHLGIITFFTFNDEEVRAWQIEEGTTAKQAAGKVHTDLMNHFIRAEIVSSEDFLRSGSLHNAREKGLVRIVGKDELIRDGDIVRIRANA